MYMSILGANTPATVFVGILLLYLRLLGLNGDLVVVQSTVSSAVLNTTISTSKVVSFEDLYEGLFKLMVGKSIAKWINW